MMINLEDHLLTENPQDRLYKVKKSENIQDCYLLKFLKKLGLLDKIDLVRFYTSQKAFHSMSPIEWCVSGGGIPPEKLCFLFEYWSHYQVFTFKTREQKVLRVIDHESNTHPCESVGAVILEGSNHEKTYLIGCLFMPTCCHGIVFKEGPVLLAPLDKIQLFLGKGKNSKFYSREFEQHKEIKMLVEILNELQRREIDKKNQFSDMLFEMEKLKANYFDIVKQRDEFAARIEVLNEKIAIESDVSNQLAEIESKNNMLLESNNNFLGERERLKDIISKLETSLYEGEAKIKKIEETIQIKDSEIRAKIELNEMLGKNLINLQQRVEEFEKNRTDIEEYSKRFCGFESLSADLQDRLTEKENEIKILRNHIEELQINLHKIQDEASDLAEKVKEMEDAKTINLAPEEVKMLKMQLPGLNEQISILPLENHEGYEGEGDSKPKDSIFQEKSKTPDLKLLAKEYIKKVDSAERAIQFLLALLELERIMNILDHASDNKITKILVATENLKQGKILEAMEVVKHL